MNWLMPAETAPHDRIWMAFPRSGASLSEGDVQAGYVWVNDTPYYGSYGAGVETGFQLSD